MNGVSLDKEALKKFCELYAKSQGYKLNPNAKIVDTILEGLLANERKYGYRYCPCRKVTGNKDEDSRIICPCEFHHREIEETGYCACNLFHKADIQRTLDTREKMEDRAHYNWDIVSGGRLLFVEHSTPSGLCSNCIKCGRCEVGIKARTGRPIFPETFGISQFGAEKRLPNLKDLQILPELFGSAVIFRDVKTDAKIGGFDVTVPITIAAIGSTPVGYSNRRELSAGAAKAGIIRVIGENVFPTYGEDGLKECIRPFLDNYAEKGAVLVQVNIEDQKMNVPEKAIALGAHGIELKFGQGAKQGLGGEIKFRSEKDAEKYKRLGYTIIKRPDGTFERHSSPGTISKEVVRERLITHSKLKVPIWIKVGMGRDIVEFLEYLADLKRREKVALEAVTVDGFGGGTGMSPWPVMNETGLPSASILHKLREKLNYDVIIAGGICDGMDIAKVLMLGANGVAMCRAFLIAANTAHEKGVVNFVAALKEELQMICAMLRKTKIEDIRGLRQNLSALSHEAEEIFGVKAW